MTKEYGVSASFSMVENEDGVMAGFHYADTEDLDVDVSVEGENREEVLSALIDEIVEETIQHSLGTSVEEEPDPEMTYEALQEENAQLRDEIQFLRARLDDANDNTDARIDNNVIENKGNQSTNFNSQMDIWDLLMDLWAESK